MPRLSLSRHQILAFRRTTGALHQRLPPGPRSLRLAAWAGLQDSSPRAALLSLHARVRGTTADAWEHPSLVQLWGPRFNDYVVSARDLAVFSLGRLPLSATGRARAFATAERLRAFLDGRRMPFGQAGHTMGVPPNSLRYAAATGTVLLRWDGARAPVVHTVPPPAMDPAAARLELARRFLHIFGPATAAAFSRWAGVGRAMANAVFQQLSPGLTAVRTPIGEEWILAADEPVFRAQPSATAPARLLPAGDSYFLTWGADREILVPEPCRRAELWTSRVWPGALLLHGEIAGVWRRSSAEIDITPWRRLSSAERAAVEEEAASLPLPTAPIAVRWNAAARP
jgi:hypothetical protein